MSRHAVMRSIGVIGAAAPLVSRPVRDAHPEITWRQIIGMPNRLIHACARISLDTI